ncbi:MAG: LURP-one-related family protein [Saprospiraceae bacterium]
MKHFKIQQKAFSFGGKYIVTDDLGHEEYIGKSKVFSFRKHTTLTDSLGNVTYQFHKKLFSWKEEFFIHENGVPSYRLFKNRLSVRSEIFVESLTDSKAFYVKGNFWGHEYNFYKGEYKYASVSKKFPAFADTYNIQIEPGNNNALVFAVVIIIDIMKDKRKKS